MNDFLTSPTAATVLLPKRDFVATAQLTSPGQLLHCPTLFQNDDPFGSDNQVLADTPLVNCEWATLYAYMHRRFGPPNCNSVVDVDVGPRWLLTTPDSSLFLMVCPTPSGAQYTFKPCLVWPADQEPPESTQALLQTVQEQRRLPAIHDAFLCSLLDLLRPVDFADHDINALGEVEDDSPLGMALQEFDAPAHKYVYIVDPSLASRVAVPGGVLDNANWPAFHKIIFELGGGDCGAGFSKAVAQLAK